MSRVGNKILFLREKKGITRKQLAKKLGVAEKHITEIETGRKIINEKLMSKISTILGEDVNDITFNMEESADQEQVQVKSMNKAPKQINLDESSWSGALGGILRDVPIYDYSLNKSKGKISMPIISNKVEGFSKDKVLFIEIQNDDMIGFRIGKGDVAFGYLTHELINNSISLIECNGKRAVRQVKMLDSEKVLLINNINGIKTETLNKKSIKVLAKIEWAKVKL